MMDNINSEDNIIDARYKEDDSIKYIKGKPIYYTTSQVSKLLNEPASTIRYWCKCFENILVIKTSGRNRQFTEKNIEELKFIRTLLREKKLTVDQAVEYCSEENTSVQENKTMTIEVINSIVDTKLEKYFDKFKMDLINEIQLNYNKNLNNLKNDIKKIVQIENKSILNNIDKIELEARERDKRLMKRLKESMEVNKKIYEENSKKKQGLFARLFR